MIRISKFGLATILMLFGLSSAATAQCVSPKSITGVWKANDGGTYIVRRVQGTVVWWIGKSGDNGASWTNVFTGVINGNIINGEWADLVHNNGVGTLQLKIQGAIGTGVNGFDKIGGTGSGFGGSHWFMPCHDTGLLFSPQEVAPKYGSVVELRLLG